MFDIKSRIPIIEWLPKYQLRYIPKDLIAGITISTIIIPQSLAYANLTTLPPVYGLYVSLMPCIIYAFLGTSPYNSIGAFAIVSILIAEGLQIAKNSVTPQDLSVNLQEFTIQLSLFSAFAISSVLLFISITGFGTIFNKYLLRSSFISAFSSAAAVNICTSQLKPFLGISGPRITGLFTVMNTWIYVLSNLNHVNPVTLSLSITSCILLIGIKKIEILIRTAWKSRYNKPAVKTIQTLFPDTFFTVVLISLISHFLHLPEIYSVVVIGPISAGFPPARVPWNIFSVISSEAASKVILALIPNYFSLVILSLVTNASIIGTFPSGYLVKDQDSPNSSTQSIPIVAITCHGSQNNIASVKSDEDAVKIHSFERVRSREFIEDEINNEPVPEENLQIDSNHEDIISPPEVQESLSLEPDISIVNNSGQQNPLKSSTEIKEKELPLNQEIFAVAVAGLISSFFGAYLPSPSLSRGAILKNQTNVKSPLGNLFSAIVVCFVISFLTGLVETIPFCVLAALIIIALFPVALRAILIVELCKSAMKKTWKEPIPLKTPIEQENIKNEAEAEDNNIIDLKIESKPEINSKNQNSKKTIFYMNAWSDVIIWSSTFLIVVFIDIGYGVYVGILTAGMFQILNISWFKS